MTDLNASGTGQGNTETGGASQVPLTNAVNPITPEVNPFDTLKGGLPGDLKIEHGNFEELVKEYSELKAGKAVVPENYQFDIPESYKPYVDDSSLDSFSAFAKENNLTQTQADKLIAFDAQRFETMTNEQKQTVETGEAALKTEWGDKFKENIQTANKAFKVYADSIGKKDTDFSAHFKSDPDIHRMFHFFGTKIGEDSFISGTTQPTQSQKDGLGDTFLFDPAKIKE